MRGHYEIQGRVIQRAGGVIVRDEVRLPVQIRLARRG
jgi:hypothetical protein